MRAGLPARLRSDRVLAVLTSLLGVGLLLRVYFTIVWHPAITYYSDSGIYFQDSVQSLWTDPLRTVGYSMFLRVLHAITPHLLAVTIVQHGLGLATALLLYAVIARSGAPRMLGLAPAAIILLGGDQLFIEHSALSDSLFIFLLAGILYCAVRARSAAVSEGWDGFAWAGWCGLLCGLAVWARETGLVLPPIVALWLVLCLGKRPGRRALALGALSLLISAAAVGGYVVWRNSASGLSGLTTNGNWNLYGRVAPWADCAKFTPPPGTGQLCESTPPSQRGWHSSEDYIYGPNSPAQKLLGPPYLISRDPYAMQRLLEFSESAVWGQPLDYLHAVWLDSLRLISPNAHSYGDASADRLIGFMLYGPSVHPPAVNAFVDYWQGQLYPHDPPTHRGAFGPLKEWEKLTRVTGVWMVVALLALVSIPWLVPRGPRAVAALLAGVSLALLFGPILTKSYDYRFVIPAFGPLSAIAALSGWGLRLRLAARRDPRAASDLDQAQEPPHQRQPALDPDPS